VALVLLEPSDPRLDHRQLLTRVRVDGVVVVLKMNKLVAARCAGVAVGARASRGHRRSRCSWPHVTPAIPAAAPRQRRFDLHVVGVEHDEGKDGVGDDGRRWWWRCHQWRTRSRASSAAAGADSGEALLMHRLPLLPLRLLVGLGLLVVVTIAVIVHAAVALPRAP